MLVPFVELADLECFGSSNLMQLSRLVFGKLGLDILAPLSWMSFGKLGLEILMALSWLICGKFGYDNSGG